MTRKDAELAVGAVGDDELDLAFEEAALDADHPKRVLHYEDADFFFISSPCARASSIVPTM